MALHVKIEVKVCPVMDLLNGYLGDWAQALPMGLTVKLLYECRSGWYLLAEGPCNWPFAETRQPKIEFQ